MVMAPAPKAIAEPAAAPRRPGAALPRIVGRVRDRTPRCVDMPISPDARWVVRSPYTPACTSRASRTLPFLLVLFHHHPDLSLALDPTQDRATLGATEESRPGNERSNDQEDRDVDDRPTDRQVDREDQDQRESVQTGILNLMASGPGEASAAPCTFFRSPLMILLRWIVLRGHSCLST